MKLYDLLMLVAVLVAPFLAVFIQRHLDIQREKRGRKMWVYRTLMSTRASRVAPEHVQALNMIDLEFTASSEGETALRTIWKEYLNHLGELNGLSPEERQKRAIAWSDKCNDFLAELLHKMGLCVGYNLDKVYLKKGIYSPQAHSQQDLEAQVIRRLVIEILLGQRHLATDTRIIPIDEAAQKTGKELLESLVAVLRGEHSIKAQIEQVAQSKPKKREQGHLEEP
jgi:hypothetical protein